MADTVVLEHSDGLGGGKLELSEEENGHKLVSAGPRADFPERGAVTVYGNGNWLSRLDATGADEGRLRLRVERGGNLVQTVLIEAGTDDADGGARAKLVLRSAEEPGMIELGFGEDGPYLRLTDGLNDVRLSLRRGLQVPEVYQVPLAIER